MRVDAKILVAAFTVLFSSTAKADVTPNPIFGSHMVLQRGGPIPIWGTAAPDELVEVTLFIKSEAIGMMVPADKNGDWKVSLAAPKGTGPYQLQIKGKTSKVVFEDVLVGEVWICSGQSNMEWQLKNAFEPSSAIKAADNPQLRLFTVAKKTSGTPLKQVQGTWAASTPETAPNFSAVGYFFGRDLQKALDVPVGLIHTSWGGTPAEAWTSRETLDSEPKLKHYSDQIEAAVKSYNADDTKAKYEEAVAKAKADGKTAPRPQAHPDQSPNSASRLYNAMIAPLIPFSFRGVIWYQGESNAGRAYEYRTLFPAMIRDWRKQWGRGDFPFLCVQLAPFMKITNEPVESGWAELRDAQYFTTKALPNVGMAVITDVGEQNDIHPKKKEPVGSRLALLARSIAYDDNVEARGPEFKSLRVESGKAILTFDHVGVGLEARGGDLTGFTICGPEMKFFNAKAEIVGDTVVVSSPEVKQIVAVRFGWANFPVVNFWNKNGLPASPFQAVNLGPQ